ncbi:MAG: hypothetical protein NDI61_05830 [Bdellovibrionaceae bacterium]|nr:hypothetical protein [Pseudobdellovibrionaceae bacterium]
MAASPTLLSLASELALEPKVDAKPARAQTRLRSAPELSLGSSRVLCLILQPPASNPRTALPPTLPATAGPANLLVPSPTPSSPGMSSPKAKTGRDGGAALRNTRAVAEAFLRFSPRVQMREPNMIFIDVASTSKFFKSMSSSRDTGSPESGVLDGALQLARDLGFEAKAAISDTAAGAQAFAHQNSRFICPPGEERETLQPLSLPLLLHLEGLAPWQNPRAIEQIVTFFYMLGFDKIRDLDRFSLTSFQDRWGETGALLWRRLRAIDRQIVSPLLPTEPLEEYVHLDFPVSLASLLLHQVRRSITFLFARLQGRCLFASRLVLRLHCEYSNTRHKLEIEPNSPSRDLGLFLTLLENKLDGVDLENPIRDFEIEVLPVPERVQQLDFFEPRTTDQEKLENLFSLLQQAAIRSGRYEIRSAILPEQNWERISSAMRMTAAAASSKVPARAPSTSSVKSKLRTPVTASNTNPSNTNPSNTNPSNTNPSNTNPSDASPPDSSQQPAFRHLPEYGASVTNAPRPTRLLRQPRRLPIDELQRLHILTGRPIERLEEGWWHNGPRRDYYFAVSPQGQCLWIYQDLENQEYYLHGYFD